MTNPKVDVIVGLQFGSEGKGLIAGHLGMSGKYDTVVNVNMPNAGHTYIDKNGFTFVFKVLPNGAVNPDVKVMLGPDSVFSLDQLMRECQQVGPDIWERLIIHENAVLLSPDHMLAERKSRLTEKLGSTSQGAAAAMCGKISRVVLGLTVGEDPDTLHRNVVDHETWLQELRNARTILLEGCQGYSLGLNAGFYPYCTSRDCTPARLLAGAGIPAQWLRDVIGVARLHPIRVGGNSGPGYPDQVELDWADIGVAPEKTTVTKRDRRIFQFSLAQMKSAIISCQPNHVFLNFCNYDPEEARVVGHIINTALTKWGPDRARVEYTGWGPADGDIEHVE